MLVWLKRIGFVAVIIIIAEIVAAAGLFFLGPDAFQQLRDFYFPRPPTPAVEQDGRKCSTFDGEIFCINEDSKTESPKPQSLPKPSGDVEKCSTYDGEIFCINEGEKSGSPREGLEPVESTEKCSTYDGEIFCIKEKK